MITARFFPPLLGLFFAYCGEVCRHTEGQGAEANGPAAPATDAAAQCCLHVGKPHWTQQPWATIPGSELTHIA